MTNILVIAPHPDDETLGCGGTLLKHSARNEKIHWLIMTNADESGGFSEEFRKSREKEIELVSSMYKFKSVHRTNFCASSLDERPMTDIINAISEVLNEVKPDIIYIPNRNDAHTDHTYVFDAMASCTKSFRYPYIKKVMVYETISETEFSIKDDYNSFRPNLWVNVSDYLHDKINIMSVYESELKPHPFPRSKKNIEALATFRGATAGYEYAEAFMIIKELVE
jgi:N-acetylglucosamine malate deacetylase 1